MKYVKFSLGIQPDQHVIGGDVIGFNVILVGSVRTPMEAQNLAAWIKQALKEKSAALPNGLILPATIIDIGPAKPRQ
jgi:hypothetical protein